MKRNSFLLLLPILASFALSCSNADKPLKVITFNIRYDNPRDSINAWPNRVSQVCEFLAAEKPDIFGLQEALWYQYEAVDSALSGYSSEAVGRDDGKKKGEMTPLFFRTDRFDYLEGSTFWLSPEPDRPGSKGWGASLPRIVTWVKLSEKESGELLYCFNTHFAHDSDSARIMSSGILLNEIRRIAGDEKFVLTGDFNMTPDSRAYSILTEKGSKKTLLTDAYTVSEAAPAGPVATFNGWSDKPREGRIDYVFVKSGMKSLSVTTAVHKRGDVYISDHWPVIAVIRLR